MAELTPIPSIQRPSDPGYQRLLTGIASIQAAIGSPSDPTTLRGGLAALKSGVTSQLQPGVAALTAGVTTLKGEIDSSIAHDVPQLKAVAGSAKTAAQTLAVGNGCLNPATGAMNPAANAVDVLTPLRWKYRVVRATRPAELGTVRLT